MDQLTQCRCSEISEAELKKVYEAALQTEVNVKKGFSDIAKPVELEQAHSNHGIEKDMKKKAKLIGIKSQKLISIILVGTMMLTIGILRLKRL